MARGRHLEVLQWLRLNGCDWDHETVDAADRNGYHHVVDWAEANRIPPMVHYL